MSVQQTLTGDEADEPRRRPNTMLWCPVTSQYVLRSRRDEWPHELIDQDDRDITDEKEDLSDDCNILTQTYEIEFIDEYRETVRVEASHKSEAKEKAELQRTYNGELIDTLHTTETALGEESPPTIDYLEYHGLLPDDHDVTQADIERLVSQNE